MAWETHDYDLGELLQDLSMNLGDPTFYELEKGEKEEYLATARTSGQFAALNYLWTGNYLMQVANYIQTLDEQKSDGRARRSGCDASFFKEGNEYMFKTNTTIGVEVVHEVKEPDQTTVETFEKLGYQPLRIIDLEFIERFAATDRIINAVLSNEQDIRGAIYSNEFRHQRMGDIHHDQKILLKRNKYSGLVFINKMGLLSDEETELYLRVLQQDRVDKTQFTGFGDKEKIHLMFAVLKNKRYRKDGGAVVPIYVGIGNNYPFTRKLQQKNKGDDRFFRTKLLPDSSLFKQEYVQGANGIWVRREETLTPKETKEYLREKINQGDLTFKEERKLLEETQRKYKSYFNQVFSIEERMAKFEEKTGQKIPDEQRRQNLELMLNPEYRIRAATAVAYSYLLNLRIPKV
jgi:hypothetical protein